MDPHIEVQRICQLWAQALLHGRAEFPVVNESDLKQKLPDVIYLEDKKWPPHSM